MSKGTQKLKQQPPKAPEATVAPVPAVPSPRAPALKHHLFEELKRRNVIRVAILYLIACWVILEPTHVVFHMLDVPLWANRLVIVLMSIGFPLVLLFAWIYEVTPQGLKLSTEVDRAQSITRVTGRKLDRAIIAVLTLALIYFVVDKFWLSRNIADTQRVTPAASEAAGSSLTRSQSATELKADSVSDKSIAVLPFVDMSEKKDQEYFADGLSEELIDRLAHSPDLRVVARTSCFFFKGKQTTIGEVARTLRVSHVLEGSVRKSGNALRITAQLVRASDGSHLWSQSYDRNLVEIFKVQDDIAGTVAEALQVVLRRATTGGAGLRAPKQEAYNLVLQGNYLFNRGGDSDTGKALELYRQATRIDSNYALAWAKVSRSITKDTTEHRAEALEAARKAVSVDPNLAYAHYVLGRHLTYFEWDWLGAKEELERAIELDPDFLLARVDLAYLTKGMFGQFDEKIEYLRQIVANDPLDPYSLNHLGGTFLLAERFEEATSSFKTLVQLNPEFAGAYANYAEALLLSGKAQEALTTAEKETDEETKLFALAIVQWAVGDKTKSDAALALLAKKYGATAPGSDVAAVYAYRGEADAAFEWLEKAYRHNDSEMSLFMADPLFRSIRGDPRFHALLVKMRLDTPSHQMSRRAESSASASEKLRVG